MRHPSASRPSARTLSSTLPIRFILCSQIAFMIPIFIAWDRRGASSSPNRSDNRHASNHPLTFAGYCRARYAISADLKLSQSRRQRLGQSRTLCTLSLNGDRVGHRNKIPVLDHFAFEDRGMLHPTFSFRNLGVVLLQAAPTSTLALSLGL